MLNTLRSFADEDEPISSVYSNFTHCFDDCMYTILLFLPRRDILFPKACRIGVSWLLALSA